MKYNGVDIVAAGYENHQHPENEVYTSFVWDIIDVCNYKCSYCSAGYGHDEHRPVSTFFKGGMTRDVWRSVLLRLKILRKHEWEISLLGGEPTLHPDLRDIVDNLSRIDSCQAVYIITNMTKSLDYFMKLCDNVDRKLTLNPSIHFEYYKPVMLDKTLNIHLQTNTSIQPTVMLHDNKRYWSDMMEYFDMCIDNDIEYNSTFLEIAYDYTPEYTDEFFEVFSKYLHHGRGVGDTKYPVTTADGAQHQVTVQDIYVNNIKKFKGWECTPKSWKIDSKGGFENSCTKERLSMTGGNLSCKAVCPNDTCGCNEWWLYDKRKI